MEQGETASPQSAVVQIVNLNRVIVQLNISESSLKSFETGKEVKVNIPSLDETFNGEVTFIAPAANVQTLTFPVEIVITNTEQLIKSGMLAEVFIDYKEGEEQIVIPTQGVIGTGDETYVFVVKDGKAVKQQVTVKAMTTNDTYIASGLSEGDQIVIKGQYGLKNGAHVEIIQEEGKSS